jgi:trans-aconitate 2-methyltransferase
MKEVVDYYDNFVKEQVKNGISKRNEAIQDWCLKFGLSKNSNVLEIGCGIGTQTELLASFVKNGKITAVDISPRSIEVARDRLLKFKNLTLIAGDVNEIHFEHEHIFDYVIMPDVIEHIPIELHFKLFKKIYDLLKDDGKVVIHIPNPYYLNWCIRNTPEKLQVIDQPIYTDLFCSIVYPNGFYIHYLETYEIWTNNCDYQIIILKKTKSANNFSYKYIEPSFKEKVIYKIKSILKRDAKT